MSLPAEQIAVHPQFLNFLRMQSRALLQAYNANARMASVFATQQRWLLAHAALAMYLQDGPAKSFEGIRLARFLGVAIKHDIASRNTADAFVKEMLRYGFLRQVEGEDRRTRPLVPVEATLDAITGWVSVHLSTLDQVDNGTRLSRFLNIEHAVWRLHPAIAEGLLASPAVRKPQKTFSLFTWLNNGGIIMEWLTSGLGEPRAEDDHIATPVFSIADMARWVQLSRTHLSRKLREAEDLGSLGWQGQRENSAMWVSKTFLQEIIMAQAAKLSIIDAAFDTTFGASD